MSFAAVLERLTTLENPYPGLRPFETSESPLFFGRDQQTLDLLDRLTRNRFVAVLGLSGSGKSSLVRAGLVPALQSGRFLGGGLRWHFAIAKPQSHPFSQLAESLGCTTDVLRSSSHGLIEFARGQLESNEALLVVIDQFEDLFRYKDVRGGAAPSASAASGAAAFIELLLASSGCGSLPIYVVITMRTDYLGDCAEFPDFPEALNESQYLVPRLTREQRRQAIEGPLGHVRISSALVERMLNEAGDEPDQLPVLQHALMRTWSEWRRSSSDSERPIEGKDYDAAGGFAGALNQHADELLKTPAVLAKPNFVEIIFKRLTALGRGNRERRDPAPLSELWELCGAATEEERQRVNDIIDVFRQGEATFLTPRDGALEAGRYIDIAHESLIRNWRILREKWLLEEEQQAETLIELADRARGWRAGKRGPLVGLDLKAACDWDAACNHSSVWAEHYVEPGAFQEVGAFLSASQQAFEQAEREERERRESELATRLLADAERQRAEAQAKTARRLRYGSIVLAVALAVALLAGSLATVQEKRAEAYARQLAKATGLNEQRLSVYKSNVLLKQEALSGDNDAVEKALKSSSSKVQFLASATPRGYNSASGPVYGFQLYPNADTVQGGLKALALVTYKMNNPTFKNTILAAGPDREFKASYEGWGCLGDVIAVVEYSDPDKEAEVTDFDMCHLLGWQ